MGNILFSILAILLFHNFAWSQKQVKGQGYIFPENDSEFTVEFPEKPIISVKFLNDITYTSAVVISKSGRISALNTNIPTNFLEKMKEDDTAIVDEALQSAKRNGIQDLKVITGRNALGKYVKSTGYKILDNIRFNSENYVYYGQSSKIDLSILISDELGGSKKAKDFLNSFKKRANTEVVLKPNLKKVRIIGKLIPIYQFPENSLEFAVSFPEKPEIQEVRTQDKGIAKVATLSLEDCFLRAESIPLSQLQSKPYREERDDNELKQEALKVAELGGFSNVTVELGRNNLGRFVKMRGFKKIHGITFFVHTYSYYGRNSVILLTVGAPSKNYPETITKFLDSLKLVN